MHMLASCRATNFHPFPILKNPHMVPRMQPIRTSGSPKVPAIYPSDCSPRHQYNLFGWTRTGPEKKCSSAAQLAGKNRERKDHDHSTVLVVGNDSW